MKKMKILSVATALILCFTLMFGNVISAAALSTSDILLGMIGGNGVGSVNVTQIFTQWLQGKIEEESPIDKFVENIKNHFNGVTPNDPDIDDDEEVIAVIDKAEAGNIAELFNLTVNELKKGQPAFLKTESASMSNDAASSLKGGLGAVNGIVASLVGSTDLAAAIINGMNNDTQIRTKYPAGNDVINNLPVSSKEYVACLTAEDIKDYQINVYSSGAYKIHIDLQDAEGASSESGLAHVFNTTDKANATLNFGSLSLNVNVMFKYVNNYVECQVNRYGEITSYTQKMGITFLFKQDDGSYSSVVPYLGVDFEKENIVYEIITDYSNIDFSLRKMGDANNDNKVNSTDARFVLRAAAGLEQYTPTDKVYCDVNRDGKVTASDAREILRAASSLVMLPTTAEVLGVSDYVRDENTEKHIKDLLILIVAYQSAKDEKEQKELADYYDKYYKNDAAESTTSPSSGTIPSTGDKVSDIIGGISDIIGGFIKN